MKEWLHSELIVLNFKKIGVSETMFSHQVAGRRKMTREQKRTLAKTLKVRIRDIMKLTKSE